MPADERPFARLEVVSSGFLETLGVPLVEGRAFDARDTLASAPVALVNQEFVRRHFQRETAVGRGLLTGRRTTIAIVGVVGDVKARPVALTAEPTIYFALSQSPPFRTRLAVRAHGNPQAILPMVRRVVTAINPDLPVFEVRTLEQYRRGCRRDRALCAVAVRLVRRARAGAQRDRRLRHPGLHRGPSHAGIRRAPGARRPSRAAPSDDPLAGCQDGGNRDFARRRNAAAPSNFGSSTSACSRAFRASSLLPLLACARPR